MDADTISRFLLERGCDYIQFKTNVPSASHMGGVWERQIRSVRSVLSALLHTHGEQLDDEGLRTFMCEAAAVVNCRPLNVDCLGDLQSTVPLTPNSILTMKSKVILSPSGNFQRSDMYCRRRWRRVQYLLNEFWTRWKSEFLQNLQIRNKWTNQKRNLKEGDIVIIKDDNVHRNQWRLGRIVEAISGEDNIVRKVRVALATDELDKYGKRTSPISYLERPIHKLVLFRETEENPVKEP